MKRVSVFVRYIIEEEDWYCYHERKSDGPGRICDR